MFMPFSYGRHRLLLILANLTQEFRRNHDEEITSWSFWIFRKALLTGLCRHTLSETSSETLSKLGQKLRMPTKFSTKFPTKESRNGVLGQTLPTYTLSRK